MDLVLLCLWFISSLILMNWFLNRHFYSDRKIIKKASGRIRWICQNFNWINSANFFISLTKDHNLEIAVHINNTAIWQGDVNSFTGFDLLKLHRTELLAQEFSISQESFDQFMKDILSEINESRFIHSYANVLKIDPSYELFPLKYHLK